ncbi:hypothetical protein MMC21_000404 [Puttea exsequens]|nr:hypothetical protein [Puttea exsequens]
MHLTLQTLVLAALSLECALAQPAHRHEHKHRRELDAVLKRDPQDYSKLDWANICKDGACWKGPGQGDAPKPPAAAAVSPAPVVAPEKLAVNNSPESVAKPAPSGGSKPLSTSGGTGSCSDLSSVWTTGDTSRSDAVYMGDGSPCPGGCTAADGAKYTSFGKSTPPANLGETDGYRGNVGIPYGHNLLPLTDCDVSNYDYSITFTNNDNSQIKVALWNKVGDDYNNPTRKQTGMSRNAFFEFPLESKQSASFAIAPNSQVAFSQACARNANTGLFDCTWGEADFANQNNKAWNGYDRSSIPNSAGNTGLLTVCADGFSCSSQQGNSFVSANQLNTGGNTNVPTGPMHLKVTMGG